jgi:hypothetical protein
MSVQQIKIYDATSNVNNIAPNTWTVDPAFSHTTLEWMQDIWVNQDNEFQVTRPHHRLLLKPGEDHRRLQQIGQDIIPVLNEITGIDLNLMIVKYWLDLPGFACQIHSDAEDIIVSFQVYINAIDPLIDRPCHGIEFLHTDTPFEIEIKPNHGYINLNTDLKLHQVLPGMGTRTSVTFQYNRV